MAIDPHYIPAFSIEDVLLDRDTGAPLSGGLVYFEQDNQRGILKPIYQITGTSPNYSYIQLPNPMTLSSIGTFEDSMGNPVVPYFFPYDSEFNVELYYVRVTSSADVPQFAREAVPYVSLQEDGEILSVITNEISNPQFIEVLFDTSAGAYTYSVNTVVDSVISIAPDWDLIVSAPGAGTVTVTQLKPSGSLNILTNPGTILTINSAGLTKLQLRQRITGSPNLWGSGYLSASFVAKTYSGTGVTLDMFYSQSSGTVIDQLLVSASLPASGDYVSFPGSALIPPSNSVGTYPTAYVDIYFDIPLSIQIDITSVMVAFTGASSIANINYDQESKARQIDHLYHYAYPIVPVGTIIDFAGFVLPPHYLICNGAAYNRIQYNLLFQSLTWTETVSLTSGSPTFTVANGLFFRIGMNIEGTGVPAATTVSNVVANTITMSANATVTGTPTVRFFAWGNGNGSTTFNVPNLTDQVTAGAQGTGILPNENLTSIGGTAGAATHTQTINEMPSHHHSGLFQASASSTSGPGAFVAFNPVAINTGDTGNGVAFNITQLTTFVNKFIRYQ